MRISFDWLKEFVDITSAADEVAHRLTMAGLEIEGMEKAGDDVVMEVNVTPNRPDCLSILGIAREASALFNLPLKLPDTVIKDASGPSTIKVVVEDPELCSRYTGRSVLGVTVKESPVWMKERLEKCGIRAINNVVDVTNYILLEFGHPLHAFDADKIGGSLIRVAKAGSSRTMNTLDGIDRELVADSLLIWDAAQPVAIAGVMGGEGSSVTDEAKNIFLESAHFSPSSIRKTSKILGLKTESSYRFERGTDQIFLEAALNRAAILIKQLGGGSIHDIVDVNPVPYKAVSITVPYKRVYSLIGISIDKVETRGLLSGIGIETEDRGDEFIACPPPFRGDLREPVDIIEEIARCYGYDRIPARPPRATLSDGMLNHKERTIQSIRASVRRSGFCEVINFSFMNSDDLDVLSIEDHEKEHRRRHLSLKNPLRQEECMMRTTLVPALIRNFLHNLSRGVKDIRIFEFSRVFIDHGRQLPVEGLRIAGLYCIDSVQAVWKESSPAFYLVKGMLDDLFSEVRLPGYEMRFSSEKFLHSGKSADIYCGEINIGYMGELSPHVIERLDIKLHKPQIIVFELDIDHILALIEQKIVYRQIPLYPPIERDVALIVGDSVSASDVLNFFREFRSELMERIELFDYYKGKNIPDGCKSLGIRVTYRHRERTLAEAEIEPIHAGLVDYVISKTGARIRGV